ncbi:LCP family glycopolymer transferase [Amycolatopsis rhabdoformis]|uniref:LCP family glycopolymer transferase n=1 Tax=Amycolatopsis rhabdoformis TaxID=1448059 RepID=UPI003898DB4C
MPHPGAPAGRNAEPDYGVMPGPDSPAGSRRNGGSTGNSGPHAMPGANGKPGPNGRPNTGSMPHPGAPAGPNGETDHRGMAGQDSPAGPRRNAGPNGTSGPHPMPGANGGANGKPGPNGKPNGMPNTGSMPHPGAPAGPNGNPDLGGMPGPDAPAGPRRNAGANGTSGPHAMPGANGRPAPNGKPTTGSMPHPGGPAGPNGNPAGSGMPGPDAPAGAKGNPGPNGMTGPRDMPGGAGPNGMAAQRDVPGGSGPNGMTGPRDVPGGAGPNGMTGPRDVPGGGGPNGNSGPNGKPGPRVRPNGNPAGSGLPGGGPAADASDEAEGMPGPRGLTGAHGVPGSGGANGKPGANGRRRPHGGANGRPGSNGAGVNAVAGQGFAAEGLDESDQGGQNEEAGQGDRGRQNGQNSQGGQRGRAGQNGQAAQGNRGRRAGQGPQAGQNGQGAPNGQGTQGNPGDQSGQGGQGSPGSRRGRSNQTGQAALPGQEGQEGQNAQESQASEAGQEDGTPSADRTQLTSPVGERTQLTPPVTGKQGQPRPPRQRRTPARPAGVPARSELDPLTMTDEMEAIDEATQYRRKIDHSLARFSAAHDEMIAEEDKRRERMARLTARPVALFEQTRTALQRVVAPTGIQRAITDEDEAPESAEEAAPQTRLQEKKQRHNERAIRIGRIAIIVLAALILLGTGVAWGAVNWFDAKFTQVSALDENSSDIQDAGAQANDENFLMVGSDSRDGASAEEGVGTAESNPGARSDTVMVAHVPADRKRVVVVSFPRDLEIARPDCNRWDPAKSATTDEVVAGQSIAKLNTAYAVGGPQCVTKVVQKITGLRINHFVGIDFNGFKDMVDAVHGVTIQNEKPIDDEVLGKVLLETGDVTISGDQALNYVRARHVKGDPTSDYGRIKRQQAFIGALLKKVMSSDVVLDPGKLSAFITAFAKATFGDNLGVQQMMTLAQSMRGVDPSKINFMTVPTTGTANKRGNEVLVKSRTDSLFQALRDNTPLPGEKPTTADNASASKIDTKSTEG